MSLENVWEILKQSDYYGLFEPYDECEEIPKLPEPGLTPWTWSVCNIIKKFHDNCEKEEEKASLFIPLGAIFCQLFGGKPVGEVFPQFVHQAIAKIPSCFIYEVLLNHSAYRIDVNLTDDKGRTPMMIAIQEASKSKNKEHWDNYFKPLIDLLFQVTCRTSKHTEFAPELKGPQLFDANGRYLLHITAKEGLPWFGLKDILEANVDALCKSDGKDNRGLLPFMLASNSSSSFELLRSRPDILLALGFE